ncbi:hypothetical protein ANN_03325 [Periplaneta americana]|uniref:GIY-YIG domain-containing protein n=1 Tax=Periplaneta americana TaxID=6978 RepID=A0ABQ8U264_PERAM|nr:hypothetical protein ANN_03325 [Periplaneta americana]
MSTGSNTESYPAFALIGLRENPKQTSTRSDIETALWASVFSMPITLSFVMETNCSGSDIETALWASVARHKKQQQQPITDSQEVEKPAIACLPFTGRLSGKISRLLYKHGIKTIHKGQISKRRSRPRSIYRILCECEAAYIGQTGRTITTRLSEHQRSIRLMQPEKSGLAEHCIEKSHRANFNNTEVLAKCSGYWDRKVKETLAIAAERGNLNRDSGLQLSVAWAPAIKFLNAQMTGRHQRRTHKNSSAEPIMRPAVNQPKSTKQDDTSAAFAPRSALIRANQRTAPQLTPPSGTIN